ncbi:hypothetical protein [Leptospira brenneri]|uniref:hypothetical protein n=1 Tax=Leptospira brenneri TaxID=2023182 RepID=UPI000F652B2B|nr:hypothetical protein [Leptospira brenneri]
MIRHGFSRTWLKKPWTLQDAKPFNSDTLNGFQVETLSKTLISKFYIEEEKTDDYTIQIQIQQQLISNFYQPAIQINQIGEGWEFFIFNEKIAEQKRYIRKRSTNIILPLNKAITFDEKMILVNIHLYGEKTSPNLDIKLGATNFVFEYSNQITRNNDAMIPFSSGIFFVLGVYLIIIFYRIRKFKTVLFFGIFQIAYSIFFFTLSDYAQNEFIFKETIPKIRIIILYLSFLSIIYFHDYYLINKLSWITKFNSVVVFLSCLLVIIDYEKFQNLDQVLVVWETPQLFFYFYLILKIIKSDIIKKKRTYQKFNLLDKFRLVTQNRASTLFILLLALAFSIYLETIFEWYFKIQTPIVPLTSITYSIFMASFIIRKLEKASVQNTFLKVALMHEKFSYQLEKEIFIEKERLKTFTDIHDETSADLTFLRLRIESLTEKGDMDDSNAETLIKAIKRIADGIREKLNYFYDTKALKENLIDGLHLLLLRKYEPNAKTTRINKISSAYNSQNFVFQHIETLSKIIREIANNDIKYGIGVSHWNLIRQPDKIQIEIISQTRYRNNEMHIGFGEENIRTALFEINLKLENKSSDDLFHWVLTIPHQNYQSLNPQ